jgi:hypothetical protein
VGRIVRYEPGGWRNTPIALIEHKPGDERPQPLCQFSPGFIERHGQATYDPRTGRQNLANSPMGLEITTREFDRVVVVDVVGELTTSEGPSRAFRECQLGILTCP